MSSIDYSGNANQRTPCVLVLDCSGSMATSTGSGRRTRMDALNDGIAALQSELLSDDTALVRVQLAIVSVGGPSNDADIMLDWTDATEFQSFPMRADGPTPLGKGVQIALQMVEQAKTNLRAAGVSYTRPWMMVISDGEPTDPSDVWTSAVAACRDAETARRVEIFSIGVEGANLAKLGELSSKPPQMLSGTKFRELFVWLSASLSAASRSRPGETIQLPSPDPWRNVGI
jgi:uncharacterized protein YegL